MIIEIRGTGTHNKGAELMLCAIQQRLRSRFPDAQFAVSPTFGPYEERAGYGLLTKLPQRGVGRSRLVHAFMSGSFRHTYGLVSENDIDVVLDASGFAFGDQWGPGPSIALSKAAKRWKQRGTPTILLPQAFGPFNDDRVRSEFMRALNNIPLVYARDRTSFEYLQTLDGPHEHVRQAPDFTCIVKGIVPEDHLLPHDCVCIVPNIRMIDRTSERESSAYIDFLACCVTTLHQEALTPVLLFHEPKNDRLVADRLEERLQQTLQVFDETNPIRLKGLIGQAVAVIGSRFHALVGALSQAVPALGTSWSHKYEMLFSDYGCDEWLLSPSTPDEQVRTAVTRLCDRDTQRRLRDELAETGKRIEGEVESMFHAVERIIGT